MQRTALYLAVVSLGLGACGDDGHGGTEADELGVGAECVSNEDCLQSDADGGITTRCLQQFTGGYCGIEDCASIDDCPEHSACVAHDDGKNYCFRLCLDKGECNINRSSDSESNCSANVVYVDGSKDEIGKSCVPPSSG